MNRTFLIVFALLAFLISNVLPGYCSGQRDAALPSAAEIERLGKKMYRDGLLPSGEEMQAVIKGDVHVPGPSFSCVSCHLHSGIGSIEGEILTPPTNGAKLYKPYYQYNPVTPDPKGPPKSMMDNPAAAPLYRRAYTDAALAEVIRSGINPEGRKLNPVMPQYLIDDSDMAILIAYLKTLSAEISPGVTDKEIRFATVIAGDVPAAERQEMMAMLNAIIDDHNRKARIKNRYQKFGTTMRPAGFNYPAMKLVPWELKGSPAGWRQQLEEHYRREPVFALLGGLSASDWRPVHEFSEQNRIPCLLPVTDLPVISDTDWYTLYFSRGAYQEGEAAARYLGRSETLTAERPVLQIVEDTARARAVAAGFQDAWKDLGRTAPLTVLLAPGEQVSAAAVRRLSGKEQPSAILLWTSDGTASALGELARNEAPRQPVHVSSTLLKHALGQIPDQARPFTYVSSPFRLERGKDLFHTNAGAWMLKRSVPLSGLRVSSRLFSLTKVLLEPFQVVKRDFNPAGLGKGLVIMEEQFEMMLHVRRNYYRDYLFDVIGMMADSDSLDYERISFGPGQRYISKGCYIVQLAPGPKAELIRKSDWVIY